MLIVTGYREAAFLLKTVKRMVYLGYVLLRYVLIYNLEVSFTLGYFLRTLDNSNLFSISLEGSSYRESIVPSNLLVPATHIRTHKATKIHTLRPLTMSYTRFENSSKKGLGARYTYGLVM